MSRKAEIRPVSVPRDLGGVTVWEVEYQVWAAGKLKGRAHTSSEAHDMARGVRR